MRVENVCMYMFVKFKNKIQKYVTYTKEKLYYSKYRQQMYTVHNITIF
jgi:hypothetical protein